MMQSPKAVQLVRPVSTGRFEACAEALEQLSALGQTARIKVLSIAGVSRQGKSTLLELLANRVGAFKIADGTDPCTEGINMLITPLTEQKDGYLVRSLVPRHIQPIAHSQASHPVKNYRADVAGTDFE